MRTRITCCSSIDCRRADAFLDREMRGQSAKQEHSFQKHCTFGRFGYFCARYSGLASYQSASFLMEQPSVFLSCRAAGKECESAKTRMCCVYLQTRNTVARPSTMFLIVCTRRAMMDRVNINVTEVMELRSCLDTRFETSSARKGNSRAAGQSSDGNMIKESQLIIILPGQGARQSEKPCR
jgi:hypothetical protein